MQDQVVTILKPLSKLWNVMELERNAIPQEEFNESHRKVANLFVQFVFLILHSADIQFYANQHRMNVLPTLIPNSTKLKEILKKLSLEVGGIENEYLFGEIFEERQSRITTTKQKFKAKFTGPQPEKININIPSKPPALLSRPSIPKQLKRSTRGLRLQRFVVPRNVGCRSPKVFSGKLEETDKKSFHFEGSSGISNTTIIRIHSIFFPSET